MKLNKLAAAVGAVFALAAAAPVVALAKHGADDPAPHIRAAHHGTHHRGHHADDRAGHARHGADDGPAHH